MDRRAFLKSAAAFAALAAKASSSAEEPGKASSPAGDLQPIALPKHQTEGGKSVLAALQERRTIRRISPRELSPQVLSNLLWAAFGVNRKNGRFGRVGRTAASASNSQEIDLYVFLAKGVYLYEAAAHRLVPVVAGDQRARVGRRRRRG